MPFATRADLLARTNVRRLAQLAVPSDQAMPPVEALRAVISGGELSQFTQVDQDAITLALVAIDNALADADALILSYGIPETVQTSLLARLTSNVALWYLQGSERMTEDMQRTYDAVINTLKAHARGEVSLIPAPAGTPAIEGDVITISSNNQRYGATFVADDY